MPQEHFLITSNVFIIKKLVFNRFPNTSLHNFAPLWYYPQVMEIVRTILPYIQIILAIVLTAAILLQQRGSSMGGAFGGDNFSAAYHTRRGAELFLYRLSIIVSILFVASAFLSIIL